MTESPDAVMDRVLAETEPDPAARRPSGCLHTQGHFMHLVRDPDTREFLAPSYEGLDEHIKTAHDRVATGEQLLGDEGWSTNFQPYPGPVGPFSLFPSNRIAIIDSGVLPDHPLLAGAIDETHDVTGEGIEDANGHGTIQAIRQHWHEPRGRLVIVKAFAGPAGRPTVWNLLRALDFLRTIEVGFVFVAGGVDANADPGAGKVCQFASALAQARNLTFGAFVATTGNIGSKGRWCPAAAEDVTGITVLDRATAKVGHGATGGIGVLQTGPYTSFPKIDPMPLPEYWLAYSRRFRERGELELAQDFAQRAEGVPATRVEALRELGWIDALAGEPRSGSRRLRAAVELAPEDGALRVDLGAVLIAAGDRDGAREELGAAQRLGAQGAALPHNMAALLETDGDFDRALRCRIEAAAQSPRFLGDLDTMARRAFYDGRHQAALEAVTAISEVDPTFAAAHHNAAICHALAGDRAEALKALDRYEAARAWFDSSADAGDAEVVRGLLDADPIAREAGLVWCADPDRTRARGYATLAELPTLSAEAARERLRALAQPERDALADDAGELTDRLLQWPRGPRHERLARALELLVAELGDAVNGHAATAWESLGSVSHRLGRFTVAAEAFERSAAIWAEVWVRRREAALVGAGYAQLALGAHERAWELFLEANSTSFHIDQPERLGGAVVTTSLTPRILNGLAEGYLRAGNLDDARDRLTGAYAADGGRHETLIQQARMLMAQDDREVADQLLGSVLRQAAASPADARSLLRLLEDHPYHDVAITGAPKLSVLLPDVVEAMLALEVELVPEAVAGLPEPGVLPEPADGPPLTVAVLGTGLAPDVLGAFVTASVDFTREGPGDGHGSSTRRGLALVSRVRDRRLALLDVKVLDRTGAGSVDALLRGLLWSVSRGAQMLVTDVCTERSDPHFHALLWRVGTSLTVVASTPPEERGTGFPGLLAERVMLEAPPPA